MPEIGGFDLRVDAEIEIVEDARHRDVEGRKPDSLVAQTVREEVESFLSEDLADLPLKEPLIGAEAASVVARDTADRVRESGRAVDHEGPIPLDAGRHAVDERARRTDRVPGHHVNFVTTRKQPPDEMPLALPRHPCPGQVRDP